MIVVRNHREACIWNSEDHELTIIISHGLTYCRLFAFFNKCSCRDQNKLEREKRQTRSSWREKDVFVYPGHVYSRKSRNINPM